MVTITALRVRYCLMNPVILLLPCPGQFVLQVITAVRPLAMRLPENVVVFVGPIRIVRPVKPVRLKRILSVILRGFFPVPNVKLLF